MHHEIPGVPDWEAQDLYEEQTRYNIMHKRRQAAFMAHPSCDDPEHPGCDKCVDREE